jgi:hypothetical protein
MGFGGPSNIAPRAESGSTIFSAGFTPAEQQRGEPSGGVTSTWNVETRNGSAANAAAMANQARSEQITPSERF